MNIPVEYKTQDTLAHRQQQAQLDCTALYEKTDAYANQHPNLSQGDEPPHAWNTILTPRQVQDMMAEQVMNRG